VRIPGAVVETPTSLLTGVAPDHVQRRPAGRTIVRHEDIQITILFHYVSAEFQCGRLFTHLRDEEIQDFAYGPRRANDNAALL
jgi:hypothetical protein